MFKTFKVFAFVLALCLLQDAKAYCCFRNILTLPCNECILPACPSVFVPPCYRDTCDVCLQECPSSPVCSCLRSSACRPTACTACEKNYVYFPEVEYPTTVVDITPFFYSTCWC